MRRTDADPNFEETEETAGAVLSELIGRSWDAWDRAFDAGVGVDGSMPILYFGDLPAYQHSLLRVVTVGLNPSGAEFPSSDRYMRFPGASGARHDPHRHYRALNAYFESNHYRWFGDYQHVLGGLGASYTPSAVSTALHTDICSPVATFPTWSRLDDGAKDGLLADGVPLWHELIRFLQPHIIVMSTARKHLSRIGFPPSSDGEVIHTVDRYKDGTERHQPYPVVARWHDIDGHAALLIHSADDRTAFRSVTHEDKHIIGEIAKTFYDVT